MIIIDQGIDRDYLPTPGGPFITPGGGPAAGRSAPSSPRDAPAAHAHAGHRRLWPWHAYGAPRAPLAPQARIYDLPLLPERIYDFQAFLNLATAAMLTLLVRVRSDVNRRWVLCNAWSVYRLDQDVPLPSVLNYGQNPNNAFTTLVRLIAQNDIGAGGADVVFAAGNCGQYCPDERCGRGRSGRQQHLRSGGAAGGLDGRCGAQRHALARLLIAGSFARRLRVA